MSGTPLRINAADPISAYTWNGVSVSLNFIAQTNEADATNVDSKRGVELYTRDFLHERHAVTARFVEDFTSD